MPGTVFVWPFWPPAAVPAVTAPGNTPSTTDDCPNCPVPSCTVLYCCMSLQDGQLAVFMNTAHRQIRGLEDTVKELQKM